MSEDPKKGDSPAEPLGEKEQQALIEPKAAKKPPTYDQATTANASNIVVVTEPAFSYGPNPIDIQCPYCHNFCRTRIRFQPTPRTHLLALILCLFQLYCCICLPYCFGSCMNTNHYCGMCDQYLGTYKR